MNHFILSELTGVFPFIHDYMATILHSIKVMVPVVTTIPDKVLGTKWSNPVRLDRNRKVWYLFLRGFQLQSLSSRKETTH